MRRRSGAAPGKDDTLVKPTWASIRRLIQLARPYQGMLLLGGFLTLLTTAANLSLPWVLRSAIDQVVTTKDLNLLNRFAVIVIAIVLVSATISFAQFVLIAIAGNRLVNDVRQKLYSHLLRLPVAFFDQKRSGDLASHLSNDVSLLQTPLTSDLVGLVGNVVMLIGGIILALVMNPQLTGVVVGLLFLVMLGFVLFGRRLRKLTRESLDALSEAMGSMTEALSNNRLVKAFVRERHEDERAHKKLSQVLALSIRASLGEGAMGTVAFAGFFMLLLGVIWFGGRSVLLGSITIGQLGAFFVTIMLISGPMGTLASLYTRLQRAVGASDRIFALLDEDTESGDKQGATDWPNGPAEVRFEGVGFRYIPETPVLNGLTLTLPPGNVTALVGQSGGGKTTVASLLYRFYEPSAGRILIDGVDISSIKRNELRNHVGLVPQDTVLFNGTILENIQYGRLDASPEEVVEASRAANVHEFVQSFHDGYDTVVGERGITLSGGQRQRVAIARAILKNPKILVLDEATSALDSRSELLVREALANLMQGRTTLVIAHRLTTIQNADQIALLSGGKISEIGTHAELLAKAGLYSELQLLSETQTESEIA
jgi:subfamily B ATP-binding cassette protein MsbA